MVARHPIGLLALPVIIALLAPCQIGAQHNAPFPINACTDSTRILPPIDAAVVSQGGINITNRFEFDLGWDKISGSCHQEEPSPIVEGQEVEPQWVYFWNFGDGTFSTESRPVHTFPEGTWMVQAAIKPIYSDDDDPLGYMTQTITVGATDVAVSPTYTDSISLGKKVALDVNWPACQPNGRLLFALTYPKIRSSADQPFSLFLAYPDSVFRFSQVQSGPAPVSNTTIEYNGIPHRLYKWRMESVQNDGVDHDESCVVVELQVDSLVANLLPDTFSKMSTNVMALISIDETPKAGPNVLGGSQTKSSPNDDSSNQTAQFNDDAGIGNPFLDGGISDMVSEGITLNWASDPNGIFVEPQVLEPGTEQAELNYSVHFYNGGSATAQHIQVQVQVDSLLSKNGPDGPATTATYPDGFAYDLILENVARWRVDTAGLPSLGQADNLGFSHELAYGHMDYRTQSRAGRILTAGDTIRARATIDMESSNVETNEAIVRVQALRIAYPCVWGLKGYYNFRFDNAAFHRSGFNLALTMRKALCKMPNPQNQYFFGKRIPKQALPSWWWQAELGYGLTNLQRREGDSLRVGHLDLTPLLLRYIAKKPDLRLGSLTFKRGWGLSAGYTVSYLLHSNNGLGSLSFGDRLDHSFSASLDLLNLVGQPGLSFGFGWRWRNTAVTGQREWYDHPFVYAHYTFSHRLRYELKPFH
ncbi:MAG: hypothetical protein EP344_17205 [Bacteroidetes bacterium]|nr:MAG: hypothetical protein EP344_17205 [Bacteroidota bacterium]